MPQARTQRPAPQPLSHRPFYTTPFAEWTTMPMMRCSTISSSRYVCSISSGMLLVLTGPTDARRCLVQAVGGKHPRRCLSPSRCRPLPCIPLREPLPGTFRGFSASTQPCGGCQDSQCCHPRRPCLRVRCPCSTCSLPSNWYRSPAAKMIPTLSTSIATLGFRSLTTSPGSLALTRSSAGRS